MLKSMSIHQRDNKWIVKSNFVTSCLAFRDSIPTGPKRGLLLLVFALTILTTKGFT